MYRRIRTVVAAVAEERLAGRVLKMMAAAGLQLECLVGDGYSALNAVLRMRPDLLIADHMLPGLSGATLMRTLVRARVPVLPDRVLLCRTGFMLLQAEQQDGVVRIDIPATDSAFRAAIEEMRCTLPHLDAALTARAEALYRYMGFPDHIGTRCLETVSVLCAQSERCLNGPLSDLEEMLADHFNIGKRPMDRAMRHVIDAAWRSDRVEEQYRIFGNTIDAKRGRPTCREMIVRIADILRMEG